MLCRLALFLVPLLALLPLGAARAQAPDADEVEIRLELFGVGSTARPGDLAGVRLALTDLGERPRAVVVRLSIPDPDGDTMHVQRVVTLNPGVEQGAWIYARLPFWTEAGDVLLVTAHELTEGDETDAIAGRRLGSARVAPQRLVDAESALIGVVGRSRAGLDQYETLAPGRELPATGHERFELAEIDAEQLGLALPDAWLGLAPMSTIVWSEGDPSSLRAQTAEAVVEWVHRGGHLVVVLPPVGQTWIDRRTNPLREILPEATATRREGVDLERYRALLTGDDGPDLPDGRIVHVFETDESDEEGATILAGPSGEPVVVQRLIGAGAVTLVGIDLTDRALAGRVDAQRFWHRVLGQRFDTLSVSEMQAMQASENPPNFASRTEARLDDVIAGQIAKTGRAGVGVLLGLAVFAVYWVLAGPGGFALLRLRGLTRHAWAAFVGAAAVFTVVAWTGATAYRPATVEITHLSFVDHVYGQGEQRVRSWFSALLPEYGRQTVALDAPGDRGRWRQSLWPWAPPSATGPDGFPDQRSYTVDSTRPDSLSVPTRSTVKQFQADWVGGPLTPMPQPGPEGLFVEEGGGIAGALTHDLPAALENVTVVYVQRQSPPVELRTGGPLRARSLAWRLGGAWDPGETLDLGALSADGAELTSGEAYLDSLRDNARQFAPSIRGIGGSDAGDAPLKLEMLAWYGVLGQPRYERFSSITGAPVRVLRRAAHGWDLSRWFTRPCVIVVGQMTGAPCPAPVRIDGEAPPSGGRVVLRWVYPLPSSPPIPPLPGDGGEQEPRPWR